MRSHQCVQKYQELLKHDIHLRYKFSSNRNISHKKISMLNQSEGHRKRRIRTNFYATRPGVGKT